METNIVPTIAGRLSWARGVAKLSKRGLAHLARLDPSHVRLIESGHRPDPSGTTIAALATTLGLDALWLITGRGDTPADAKILLAVERARSTVSDTVAA